MRTYKGLVYVKHGRIGTRSEGPDYHLQTAHGDFLLDYQRRHPWEPDYHLEFFSRRMVEVTGELDAARRTVHVQRIAEILAPLLPPEPDVTIEYDASPHVVVLSADVAGGFVPPAVSLNHVVHTTIYGDGKVIFVDPAKGSAEIRSGHLSPAQIVELFRVLGANGFWGFEPYYQAASAPTDLPSTFVTAQRKGEPEKRVGAYGGELSAPTNLMNCYESLVYPSLDPSDVSVYVRQPITREDLERGWYYGFEHQKKLDTPADWSWDDAGRSSRWHAPRRDR